MGESDKSPPNRPTQADRKADILDSVTASYRSRATEHKHVFLNDPEIKRQGLRRQFSDWLYANMASRYLYVMDPASDRLRRILVELTTERYPDSEQALSAVTFVTLDRDDPIAHTEKMEDGSFLILSSFGIDALVRRLCSIYHQFLNSSEDIPALRAAIRELLILRVSSASQPTYLSLGGNYWPESAKQDLKFLAKKAWGRSRPPPSLTGTWARAFVDLHELAHVALQHPCGARSGTTAGADEVLVFDDAYQLEIEADESAAATLRSHVGDPMGKFGRQAVWEGACLSMIAFHFIEVGLLARSVRSHPPVVDRVEAVKAVIGPPDPSPMVDFLHEIVLTACDWSRPLARYDWLQYTSNTVRLSGKISAEGAPSHEVLMILDRYLSSGPSLSAESFRQEAGLHVFMKELSTREHDHKATCEYLGINSNSIALSAQSEMGVSLPGLLSAVYRLESFIEATDPTGEGDSDIAYRVVGGHCIAGLLFRQLRQKSE